MADNERKLWYLRRLNLFEGMAPAEVEAISRRLRERPCHRRDTILDPQAPGDRIYLVKSGSVRLYRLSREGRELTTAILRPGQLFGTSALFGMGQSNTFVEALEDAYICEATADEFLRIMVEHPVLAAKMTVLLARRLLRLEQQQERLAFQDVPEPARKLMGGSLRDRLAAGRRPPKSPGASPHPPAHELVQFDNPAHAGIGLHRLGRLLSKREESLPEVAEGSKLLIDRRELSVQQGNHMLARLQPVPSEGQDFPNLREAEANGLRLQDEVQALPVGGIVQPVAGCRPLRPGKQTYLLVVADGLGIEP